MNHLGSQYGLTIFEIKRFIQGFLAFRTGQNYDPGVATNIIISH